MEPRKTAELSFGDALEYLKGSKRSGQREVTRENWYGSKANPVVCIQMPDENSKMTEPYLYMQKDTDDGVAIFPLDLSCESVLANDWKLVATQSE